VATLKIGPAAWDQSEDVAAITRMIETLSA